MTAVRYNTMAANGFATRLFRAWHLLQIRKGGGVTQEWLGRQVGRILGEDLVSQSAVSRWFKGATPDLDTIAALGRALGVDPGWLAFGELSEAPAPVDVFRHQYRGTRPS